MAKKATEDKLDDMYSFSAAQLLEQTANRRVMNASISADLAFGGGIPMGHTMLIGGRPKSGKTSLVLQYSADAQKKYGSEIYYANIEGRLTNKVLSQIQGLDLNKVHVIMGPPIKDGDVVIGHQKMSSQKWWSIIGNLVINKPGSIIIVDSVSSLSEEAELAEGMGHQSRGGLQKLEAQFKRQYGDLIVANGITMFMIAEIQANTSGYGDPIAMKCGNALKHLADSIVFIRNIERWPANSEGRISGHNICLKVEDSPMGIPMDMKVGLRYGYGLDFVGDLLDNCVNWGFVKNKGAWYYFPFLKDGLESVELDDSFADKAIVKCQGKDNAVQWLKENAQQLKILDEKVRGILFS